MSNYTKINTGNPTLAAAKIARAVNAIFAAIAGKKKLRLVMASLLLVLLSSVGNGVFAQTWFSSTSAPGNVNTLNKWWSTAGGTGTHPVAADLTTAGEIWTVQSA